MGDEAKPQEHALVDELKALHNQTIAEHYQFLQRARALLGGADRPADAKADLARAGDLLFELAHASVKNYEQWVRLSTRTFEYAASSLFGAPGPHRPSRPSPAAVALQARAAPGDRATARFEVENPDQDAAEVAFTMPVLRGSETGASLDGAVAFRRVGPPEALAAGLTVDARTTGQFEVELAVPAETSAGRYAGDVRVLLRDRVVGSLHLDVSVEAPSKRMLRRVALENGRGSVRFQVHNPLPHPADVAITAPDLAREGDLVPARYRLRRTGTDRPRLDAGEKAAFTLEVRPEEDVPTAAVYTGCVHILAGDHVVAELDLTLAAPHGTSET